MKCNDLKSRFPLLVKHSKLAYLDSAATSQKPQSVIDATNNFYTSENSNIHRGVYHLSIEATAKYEQCREKVKSFINAKISSEIIFTKGATEAINLLAATFGKIYLTANDEIFLSELEHHSNIVPRQILAESCQAKIKVIPVLDNGELDIDFLKTNLNNKVKILAITHASNTIGTINPVQEITKLAHEYGTFVVVDGSQSVPHFKVDVQDLDCDFYVFSAHKAYGPTGVGILYGKYNLIKNLPPYQTGGNMVASVSFNKTTFADVPQRFEAGTQNICGVIALEEALNFIESIGWNKINSHEQSLIDYTYQALNNIDGIKLLPSAKHKIGVISFNLNNIHPHDVGTILDSYNVAVRVGHHCTQPLMKRFKVPATVRISFGVYNNYEDIDRLTVGLKEVKKTFQV